MKNTLYICMLFLLFFISPSQLYSQIELYSLLQNSHYSEAHTKAQQYLEHQKNNPLVYHVLGKTYAIDTLAIYDIHAAYESLQNAQKFYNLSQQFDKNRYAKIPLTEHIIQQDFIALCEQILTLAHTKKTIAELNHFINTYSNMPVEFQDSLVVLRNTMAFDEAVSENTVAAYNLFITTYIQAVQIPQAIKKRNQIEFAHAKSLNTLEAYKKFMEQYPDSDEYKEAEILFHTVIFEQITKDGTYERYLEYVQKYPKTEKAQYAIEAMVQIAKQKKSLKMLREIVEHSKSIHYKYALYEYYKALTIDGEYITLMKFVHEFGKSIPFQEIVQRDIRIAEIGENLDLHRGFIQEKEADYINYIKMAAPNDKAFVALQRLISEDVTRKNWNRALARVSSVQSYFGNNYEPILDLLRLLVAPVDTAIQAKEIAGDVNTEKGGEYSPVLSIDNSKMFFCGKNRPGNIGLEDIFVSDFVDGAWETPKLVRELSTPSTNDAPVSLSADGTKLIFFRGGTLYFSNKLANGWGQGVSVSNEINNAQWSADAMITSDGNALIFSSIRDDGYNYYTDPSFVVRYYHGTYLHQSDIYVSLRTPDGWGTPQNLGPVINTKYTDRSPFLHPDMKTLYFSSDGHGGLGGLDVFMATRLSDTCWDCWSKPVNLGKEINTHEDNWGYRITTDGKYAFYAARKPGLQEHDIFYVTLPEKFRPNAVTTISGTLTDKRGKPISATIVWEDLETGRIIGQSQSDPSNGNYIVALPQGKIYGYFVHDNKYYPLSQSIDLTGTKEIQAVVQNITAVSFQEMQEQGEAVRLNNLFFDTNKSDILPHSIPELRRAAQIIKKYNKKVEIAGHTDNVGTIESNKALSMRRAQSVRDFLIAEGCNAALFQIVGYGLSKPIDTNETSQGRANNRRVELRFVQ
ncbi:MAG: OmpA family protein [Bacteroidales bacterium]|nr:OmpA family protein [Bacteroidales bacterium]NLK80902.1 OmpA family protein [Bacteroidales bacterium]